MYSEGKALDRFGRICEAIENTWFMIAIIKTQQRRMLVYSLGFAIGNSDGAGNALSLDEASGCIFFVSIR